jgi:hypothetical protein
MPLRLSSTDYLIAFKAAYFCPSQWVRNWRAFIRTSSPPLSYRGNAYNETTTVCDVRWGDGLKVRAHTVLGTAEHWLPCSDSRDDRRRSSSLRDVWPITCHYTQFCWQEDGGLMKKNCEVVTTPYRRMGNEGIAPPFLISGRGAHGWSASRLGRVVFGERFARYSLEQRNISCPSRESNLVVQPESYCCTGWAMYPLSVKVRVPGCRARGPGPIPGATRFFEKSWVWNGVHSAAWVQLRSCLEEKVAIPV